MFIHNRSLFTTCSVREPSRCFLSVFLICNKHICLVTFNFVESCTNPSHPFFQSSQACSGVTVTQNSLDCINEMKIAKDNEHRIRILQFGFCDVNGKKQIDVKQKITQKDLNGEDAFTYLRDKVLMEKECTYVLYDFHCETKDTGCKKELVFIMW